MRTWGKVRNLHHLVSFLFSLTSLFQKSTANKSLIGEREKQIERAEQPRRIGVLTRARKALASAAEINHDHACGFIESNKYAPGEYTSGFQTAKAIFLHQSAINPADGTTIPLSSWGETPDSQSQTSCGMLLAKDYAVNLAMGNVDPKMKTSIANNFPFPAQESLWQPRDLCLSVETIDNVKINWTVPSLPVLTVEFAKLQVNNTSTMKPALTKAEDTGRVKAGNVIICTKWCDLVIESVPYLVFWEFRQSAPLELSNGLIIDVADDNNSSDEDSNDNSEYTLPFKVLGVAHSPPVQLSLLLTKLQAEADDYPRKK